MHSAMRSGNTRSTSVVAAIQIAISDGCADGHTHPITIVCRKGWVSKSLAKKCMEYARRMLEQYPRKEHWKRVRFSNEVHFGHGPQGRLLIIRKKGQRYCQNCIQEVGGPAETEKNKVHA